MRCPAHTMALSDSRDDRRPKSALRPLPSPPRVSPDYLQHPSNVPCPIPRWTAAGASVGYLPAARGLPRSSGGSASTTSLSRPAQASLALRPAGLLSRPRRPLSQGSDPASYPTEPLVSYQSYRLLSGWNLPPLVLHAFGTHTGSPGPGAPHRLARSKRGLFECRTEVGGQRMGIPRRAMTMKGD